MSTRAGDAASPSPGSDRGRRPAGQVGVNLTWLAPGIVGGSEEYSVRLLDGLVGVLPDSVYLRIYGRTDLFDHHPDLARHHEAVVTPVDPTSRAHRVWLEQTWLAVASRDDDVVHHMGGTMPLRRPPPGQRRVVTIHDLQPIDLADNFSAVKRRWLGRQIPRAVRAADAVVCPSHFTAERIAAVVPDSSTPVVVVPHGFEAGEHGAGEHRAGEPGIGERLAGQRFVVYPAISYRHKRHRDVIKALARIDPDRRPHAVFTGRRGPESDALEQLIRAHRLQDHVHVVGRIPESDLDWLYRHAMALVFPSEYEGFGNPCLEAMSRGCPVVAAAAGALPEVVGTAGLLFPVGDVARLVEQLDRLVDEPGLAAGLADDGRRRARLFTPSKASGRLWSVYRDLLPAAHGDRHRR